LLLEDFLEVGEEDLLHQVFIFLHLVLLSEAHLRNHILNEDSEAVVVLAALAGEGGGGKLEAVGDPLDAQKGF